MKKGAEAIEYLLPSGGADIKSPPQSFKWFFERKPAELWYMLSRCWKGTHSFVNKQLNLKPLSTLWAKVILRKHIKRFPYDHDWKFHAIKSEWNLVSVKGNVITKI